MEFTTNLRATFATGSPSVSHSRFARFANNFSLFSGAAAYLAGTRGLVLINNRHAGPGI